MKCAVRNSPYVGHYTCSNRGPNIENNPNRRGSAVPLVVSAGMHMTEKKSTDLGETYPNTTDLGTPDIEMFGLDKTAEQTDPFEIHNAAMYQAIWNLDVDRMQAVLQTPYVDFRNGWKGRQHISLAIQVARTKGSIEPLNILLHQANARLDVRESTNGWSPFHFAVVYVRRDVFQALAAKLGGSTPAVLNMAEVAGRTPLHMLFNDVGTMPNEPELNQIVQILLQCGANPNAQDKFGLTALAYVVSRSDRVAIPTYQLLLDRGANVDVRNICGNTVLHWAIFRTVLAPQLFALLVSRSKDINARNNAGLSPVDFTFFTNSHGTIWQFSTQPRYPHQHTALVAAGANVRVVPPTNVACPYN
jgi:ankyrin repeat protein